MRNAFVRSCRVQNCKKRTPGGFSLQAVGVPLDMGRGWAHRVPTDCERCGADFRSTMWRKKMKRRIVRLLQKYLFNPPVKMVFGLGLVRPGYALLERIGRNRGKPRRTPVGDGRIGGQFWIVAEHDMKAGYVFNIAHNPRVRLKLREGLRSRWHSGTAHLLPDDDPRERQRWLTTQLPSSATNAKLVRFLGTQLLTVRIDLDS